MTLRDADEIEAFARAARESDVADNILLAVGNDHYVSEGVNPYANQLREAMGKDDRDLYKDKSDDSLSSPAQSDFNPESGSTSKRKAAKSRGQAEPERVSSRIKQRREARSDDYQDPVTPSKTRASSRKETAPKSSASKGKPVDDLSKPREPPCEGCIKRLLQSDSAGAICFDRVQTARSTSNRCGACGTHACLVLDRDLLGEFGKIYLSEVSP
jgi:hypothetical protein